MDADVNPAAPDERAAPDEGYDEVTGPGTVRFERVLPAPVGRVWEYLTDTDKRGQWLGSGEMELSPGATLELSFHHATLSDVSEEPPAQYAAMRDGASLLCTVLRFEEPYELTLEWGAGASDSEVEFRLTSFEGQTKLVLTHRRLPSRADLVTASAGWHAHLAILADKLASVPARPFWSTHSAAAVAYERRLPQD